MSLNHKTDCPCCSLSRQFHKRAEAHGIQNITLAQFTRLQMKWVQTGVKPPELVAN